MQRVSKLEFHQGQALLIAADTYPTILDVLYEEVQNALDEGATRIWIDVNQKKKIRQITVQDNGNGASVEKFEKALVTVGRTMKKEDKLGRFGRGLVSPLGKCERFTFTSTPKDNPRLYRCWMFVTDKIEHQTHNLSIPSESKQNLVYGVAGTTSSRPGVVVVPWRTEVRIERYTEDRHRGHIDVDSLHEGILDRFATTMRKLGTVISVRIRNEDGKDTGREFRAESFNGKPLEVFTSKDKDAGVTTFRLYIARRTDKGRKGRVGIGEMANDFRMHFGVFAYAAKAWLEDEVVAALSSGIFEGEILTEKARLHASRKKFEEDQALVGLCGSINHWFDQVGKKIYDEAKEIRREEVLQECGERTMSVMRSMLSAPEFQWIREGVLGSVRYGTVTADHIPVKLRDHGELVGVRVTGGGPAEGGEHGGNGKPSSELSGDTPFYVTGPRGTQRKLVRDNSIGLGLSHNELTDPNKFWEFDERSGIITLNIGHPIWAQVEKSGRIATMRFQELLIVSVLVLQTMPPNMRDQQRLALDAIVKPFAYTLTEGDVVAGRKLGRPKSEKKKK
ncbi:hypothetical protein C4552_00460 [Candidatus Parcubacteria bacterium]|nr:MAG: hypothetical protein C4552_00460 [Candidatus Parcubacteria bacterium]